MPRRGLWRRWRRRGAPGRRSSGSPSTRWPGPAASGVARSTTLRARFGRRVGRRLVPPGLAGARRRPAARLARRARRRHGRCCRPMLATADERGESVSYALPRLHLCELELRAGAWDAGGAPARRVGRAVRARAADLADVRALPRAPGRRAAACPTRPSDGRPMRSPGRTRPASAGTGSRRCGPAGPQLCSTHDPARAAASLGASGSTRSARESTSPASSRSRRIWSRRSSSSASSKKRTAVDERLRMLASTQEHPWGLASAQALQRDRSSSRPPSYDAESAAALDEAVGSVRAARAPLRPRGSLLASAGRSAGTRKWGAAREVARAGRRLLSPSSVLPGWADEARAELARVGARRPQPSGELTPAERRVASSPRTGSPTRRSHGHSSSP